MTITGRQSPTLRSPRGLEVNYKVVQKSRNLGKLPKIPQGFSDFSMLQLIQLFLFNTKLIYWFVLPPHKGFQLFNLMAFTVCRYLELFIQ